MTSLDPGTEKHLDHDGDASSRPSFTKDDVEAQRQMQLPPAAPEVLEKPAQQAYVYPEGGSRGWMTVAGATSVMFFTW